MAILIGWIVFLRATLRSLGGFGVVLAAASLAVLFWAIVQWGVISLENPDAVTWVALIMLVAVLGVGMSWSHFRRRWSGQADVDEADRH
jgi:hypothetical protein